MKVKLTVRTTVAEPDSMIPTGVTGKGTSGICWNWKEGQGVIRVRWMLQRARSVETVIVEVEMAGKTAMKWFDDEQFTGFAMDFLPFIQFERDQDVDVAKMLAILCFHGFSSVQMR